MIFCYIATITQKFDTMIDSGLKPFIADYVIDIVSDVKGTGSWDAETKKYKLQNLQFELR